MNKLFLTFYMLLSLQAFAMNATSPNGEVTGQGIAKCIQGDAKQAAIFFDETVGVANRLKLDLAKLKNDVLNEALREESADIRIRLRPTARFESALCNNRLSTVNTAERIENMDQLIQSCDVEILGYNLHLKAMQMIRYARSHKEAFLQALESGTQEKFARKIASGSCN